MSEHLVTEGEQEYLEIIFWLDEVGLPITGANIARAMQLSPPTVHEMVGRLIADGYITRNEDKVIQFTDSGYKQAAEIVSRHRLVERFLTDVLGIPWDDVHNEAENLEHAMSPTLEARMLAAIGDAKTCPHGHPINPGERVPGAPLSDVEVGADVEILRFENEALDLLHHFKDAGIFVGLKGKLSGLDDSEVTIEYEGQGLRINRDAAATVSVIADPSPPLRTALPPEQLALAQERYGR